ncbi:uncharacterized protein LOC113215985 [Frankliniella occidentalis]|uniref:Uncharacterized protein LOC113215985 n=1 Tax=Frankliniella occidentalis TaxID=133901 RepID=A0A9C6WW01_FRAOC|nr:uncharacterized protein LOC113215985 [Frankliniella occidentalis]
MTNSPRDQLNTATPTDEEQSENKLCPGHGVVVDDLPGAHTDDYLIALTQVVSPGRITHISRTQEGVCVFLDSEMEAAGIVDEGVLEVDGVHLRCRPYRVGCHRVCLSNCLPFLRDADIIAELEKFGQARNPQYEISRGRS